MAGMLNAFGVADFRFDVQLCRLLARIMAIENRVRNARLERGLSMTELCKRVEISRQALSAIESNHYQPNVVVALRIAEAFGVPVEALFGQDDTGFRKIEAHWSGGTKYRQPSEAVTLARIRGRVVAVPQVRAAITLSPSGGRLETAKRQTASVRTSLSQEDIDTTLLIAGCDPSVSILGAWFARHRSPIHVVGLQCSSLKALSALLAGTVHCAGTHLRDSRTGEYNLGAVRRHSGAEPMVVVNFAQWEIGIATAPGNPLGIRGFEDLARGEVKIVNREQGAGARRALDEALARINLRSEKVRGYGSEVGGHLDVAAAIATKRADAGVTIRVAAEAYGLGFAPTREERYDLVVPESEMYTPPLRAMLDALNSGPFSREISQFCRYDTRQMGHVVGRIDR
jgi:putative molybdopterin biosynthesis protein